VTFLVYGLMIGTPLIEWRCVYSNKNPDEKCWGKNMVLESDQIKSHECC
jgi:hypothetical protein